MSVEIYDYNGEGYKAVMRYGAWRVAYLNHADRFKEENLVRIERHNETDEVFVLLEGEATLVIGEALEKMPMEPYRIYNVTKGTWHHILTKEKTRVLIVENEDTSLENSDYMEVKKG